MKNEKLFSAFGLIDDRYIIQAAPKKQEKAAPVEEKKTVLSPRTRRFIAVAACVCLIFALGFMLLNGAFGGAPSSGVEPIPGPGGNSTGVDRTPEPGGDSHSTNSDNNSSTIIESTPVDTESSDSSVIDNTPANSETDNQQEGTGGDSLRWVNNKYSDRLTSIDMLWCDYVKEKTGVDIDTFAKSKEWANEQGVRSLSLMEIIDDLNITREKFEEVNNKHIEAHRELMSSLGSSTEESVFCIHCFTDEEIDIIYSGDKRRIAEAFAFPYAVIADNWELYPLRWIIDNPATLYKEREISLDAIQKSVDKIIEDGLVEYDDEEALLARIEEYKKLL